MWSANDRAVAMTKGLPPSTSTALVLVTSAFHQLNTGQLGPALASAQDALGLIETLHDEDLRGRALGMIGLARVTAGDLDGVADLQRALEVLRVNSPAAAVPWLINLANAHGRSGNLDRAFAAYIEAEQAAQRFALARRVAWLEGIAPRRSYWTGRWDEAMTLADRFLSDPDKAALQIATTCLVVRGQIRLGRGEVEGMAADAAAAAQRAQRMRSAHEIGPALAFQARVLLATGKPDEAAAVAEELLGALAGNTLEPFAGADLPVILAGLGWPVARLEEAGIAGSPWLEAARAYLSGDLLGAARRYASMGALPAEAHARLRAAEQLAKDGRPSAAATELAAARGFFLRAGATAWLRAAGALKSELERD
jgi:tetratricopeptide (TPR) repeat protein